MRENVLTLTPGGSPIAQSIGFPAASVIVDNYTSSYVLLPDTGKNPIPPWTYGAVVAVGTNMARASLIPTVPAIAGPPVPVQQATLTWTAADLPPSSGHLMQQSQYQLHQKIYPDGVTPASSASPSFKVSGSSTSATQRFTLPAGTVALRLLVNAGGLLFSYSLFVGGHQSNEQYYGDPGSPGTIFPVPTPTLPFTIPVELDWDNQVDVIVQNTGSNTISVYVSALLDAESPGQAGAAQSVIMPAPAPWQAANQAPLRFVANAAAGATATIIAAPAAGLRIYLHHLHHFTTVATTAAFGYFGDGFGDAFTEWAQLVLGTPYDLPGHGYPLLPATAFVLKNESGVSMNNQTGSVVYSIAA